MIGVAPVFSVFKLAENKITIPLLPVDRGRNLRAA